MDGNDLSAARHAMANLEKGGVHPFGMFSSPHARERCQDVLNSASAILSLLEAACFDAKTVTDAGSSCELQSVNPQVLGSALSGIGTLVDLANFLVQE